VGDGVGSGAHCIAGGRKFKQDSTRQVGGLAIAATHVTHKGDSSADFTSAIEGEARIVEVEGALGLRKEGVCTFDGVGG
jgi:hypothetical protein